MIKVYACVTEAGILLPRTVRASHDEAQIAHAAEPRSREVRRFRMVEVAMPEGLPEC